MSMPDRSAAGLARLRNQRLLGNGFDRPEQVVAWQGAVQAQDYAGSKWALGMRMRDATDTTIEQAFNEGHILRTHLMRPTWHFVAPEDIRWLLDLTAPRVHAVNASMYRQVGLDESVSASANAALVEALQGGRYLTRDQAREALDQAGIPATGMRLGYILHRAELDGLICSGPRRGKQFTYALLEERAPRANILTREEALAELTRRYFTSHGPATPRDFAWWSGLTLTDARRGLQMVGRDLASGEVDGETHWFQPSSGTAYDGEDKAFLLPTYDEFLLGLALESRISGVDTQLLVFDSMIVAGGRIAGTWRRTVEKRTAVIEVAPLPPLTADDVRITAAAQQYGAFVGMPVEIRPVGPATRPLSRLHKAPREDGQAEE